MDNEIKELKEEVALLRNMLVRMAEANGMKFRKGHYDLRVSPSITLVPIDEEIPVSEVFKW
ncbi:hypothetical protein HF851_08320 [Corynebacterium ammoniagenes]|uniref:hypothetical protein n=1 Tax=Corynebacterium ammoniagenes TaxID=1697 RepID=UPI00145934E1|nr:hypothetical protein [Corynebacterium ammoniagenes]NMF32281.1 hypothetical protein [Corynebacterium ammoniagenes]